MNSLLTQIPQKQYEKILARLLERGPGYVPQWKPGSFTPGVALIQVFARYMELLEDGLRQVPERSQLVFLDMLGIELQPAQAARCPLVFSLVENSPVDVTLPKNSQVAAQVVPPLESIRANDAAGSNAQSLIFSTGQSITITRAQLTSLYSIIPGSDEFADHSASITNHFSLFDEAVPCLHAVYLGHDELFALAGDISVILSLTLRQPASRYLSTEWEYLTDQGWLPFTLPPEDDTTDGLRKEGQMILRRECGPNAKQETIAGRKSYWIRGRLTKPLLPDGTNGQRTIPVVNDVRVRVKIRKDSIPADLAFADAIQLDTSKDFYPFGEQPSQHPTFYVASKDVFKRKGAQVQLDFELSAVGTASAPAKLNTLWEYFDGVAWSPLKPQASAGIDTFTAAKGSVNFLSPRSWAETTVNGVKNYWIRVRVTGGDYGLPVRVVQARSITSMSADRRTLTLSSTQGFTKGDSLVLVQGNERVTVAVDEVTSDTTLVLNGAIPGTVNFTNGTITATDSLLPSTLKPPIISKLTLSYSYATDPTIVDHCLTENDFVFLDETEACRWPDRDFQPFRPVTDQQPTVHFGFNQPLPAGLISLYLHAPQTVLGDTEATVGSSFIWEYRSARGWNDLGVLDETLGFRRSGMIQFIGPPDAIFTTGHSGDLIRIRARSKPGEQLALLPVEGLWLNAIWASQSLSVEQEPLGQTDGSPGQTFLVQHLPVLAGEMVEVQEWSGLGEQWRFDLGDVDDGDLRFDRSPATQQVTGAWVRWHQQPHFYGAGARDRWYTIDRARGIIRFGDGLHGMIPTAAKAVRISYRSSNQTDGATTAVVPADAITELRTAVPLVASATNPIPATGGAGSETLPSVNRRGSHRIRHGGRGISAEDLEWLAHEASPEVIRARCLSLIGPAGHAQRGWITLVVVPFSLEPQPQPSAETKRRVGEYLAQRVPATLVSRIRIIGPTYTSVGVRAEIVPLEIDAAAAVESHVRARLDQFLHPLTGGLNGDGWQFDQPLHLSQIARMIDATDGVDYCYQLMLRSDGHMYEEFVPVGSGGLIATGDHELKLTVGRR